MILESYSVENDENWKHIVPRDPAVGMRFSVIFRPNYPYIKTLNMFNWFKDYQRCTHIWYHNKDFAQQTKSQGISRQGID